MSEETNETIQSGMAVFIKDGQLEVMPLFESEYQYLMHKKKRAISGLAEEIKLQTEINDRVKELKAITDCHDQFACLTANLASLSV